MDAEHRHELKTNELALWLSRLPEMIKKNLNVIIGLTLIVIGLITWPMLSRMAKTKDIGVQTQTTESIQMMERDIMAAAQSTDPQARQDALNKLLINADALLTKADELENANLAAMARIKAAQAIRTELQLRKEEVPAETVDTQINKANEAYEKAFKGATDPQVKALAQLGLGLCAEERGQTDEAAKIYDEIVKDQSYAATVVPAQAQQRLDVLQEKIDKVYFAPAPVVEAPAEEAAPPAIAPEAASVIEAAPAEAAPAERQSQAEAEEAPAPAAAPQPVQPAPAAPQPAQPTAPATEQNPPATE